MTNNTKAFTRRSFLSLGAIAIGSTVAFVSSPILASAAVGPRLPQAIGSTLIQFPLTDRELSPNSPLSTSGSNYV